MAYKKAKPSLFSSMMTLGNFSLEGSSSYSSRRVVICVRNDDSKVSSCIPLESVIEEIVVGAKRNLAREGLEKKTTPLLGVQQPHPIA